MVPAAPARGGGMTPRLPEPAPVIPNNTWTSLNRWAALHGIEMPRRLTDSPLATYVVKSSQGSMVLAIGSREALWNGHPIHLGFDPEMVDGEVWMNGLDLAKNLQPLLCSPGFPMTAFSTLVLDPGHGGMNSGTISVLDHRPEKDFTLDLALRMKPLLEASGWRVFLTRTRDVDMSLSNRVQFAENHHADLFISLHFNSAAPDRRQSGVETYCLTPSGMPSTLTRGFADPWQENLPNNQYDALNLLLAVRLQASVVQATGEEDRGVRRARFIGVLRGQNRPAVLIEAGYLSNPAEAARIEDPRFRESLAIALASALDRSRGDRASREVSGLGTKSGSPHSP